MKFTMILVAWAGLVNMAVSSRPVQKDPQTPDIGVDGFGSSHAVQTDPQPPEINLDRFASSHVPSPLSTAPPPAHDDKALVSWDPADAYVTVPRKKRKWEQICEKALPKHGCGIGVIHRGESRFTMPNGDKALFVNVEGAPLTDLENTTKLRIFRDGSSMVGWRRRDRKKMVEAKRVKKHLLLESTQPPGHRTAAVVWDPVDVYEHAPKKKLYWEQRCGPALASFGCGHGTIHAGERRLTKHGPERYVNVEGTRSLSGSPMLNPKKIRVFLDGSSTNGWSKHDKSLVEKAKRRAETDKQLKKDKQMQKDEQPLDGKHPLEDKHPVEGRTALLSWDPPSAYQDRGRKTRVHWGKVCSQALLGEGCRVGKIHQGKSTGTKPTGEKSTYVRVEGAPSVGMEYEKKMRVFHDGSWDVQQDGWTERDRVLMTKSKIPRVPDRRRGEKNGIGMKVDKIPDFNQPHPQEDTAQDKPKHTISWYPPNPYGGRFAHLISSYEMACRQALDREGCDFGVMHQGQHHLKHNDGTRSLYMNVLAGNKEHEGDARYMRLFENGSSEWYQPGEVPKKPRGSKNQKTAATVEAPVGGENQYPAAQDHAPALTQAQVAQLASERPRKRPKKGGGEFDCLSTQESRCML